VGRLPGLPREQCQAGDFPGKAANLQIDIAEIKTALRSA